MTGVGGGVRFLTNMAAHLPGLMFMFKSVAHFSIFSSAVCSFLEAFLPYWATTMSSAYSWVKFRGSFGMGIVDVWREKSRGARTLPWGTEAFMGCMLDKVFPTRTWKVLPCMYE